jgi:hypothetical protein
MLLYIFNTLRVKRLLAAMLVGILAIVITMSCVTANYKLMAVYAEPSVTVGCGPTQQPNFSITVITRGFLPNTFIPYKYMHSDNSVVPGGFSAGTFGENTVAVNVGPYVGTYTVYIYKDINSYNTGRPIYSSNITLPCVVNHFASEYYKGHPQAIQYLLGIKSIYNKLKLGDYLITSLTNSLKVLNSSNSKIPIEQLAAQLLTAELNIVNGAGNCINGSLSSANTLLKSKNYNGPNTFPAPTINEDQGQMLSIKDKIEAYNLIGCNARR